MINPQGPLHLPPRPKNEADPHKVYDRVTEKFDQVQDWVDIRGLDGSEFDFNGNPDAVSTVIDFATNKPKLEQERDSHDHVFGVTYNQQGGVSRFSLYERNERTELSTYGYSHVEAYRSPDIFSYQEAGAIRERHLPRENEIKPT